jgi:DNA-binding NtrC family response regulator
MDTKC